MPNKNNDEILNELFFKKNKKSYSERQAEKQAQYKPVDKTSNINSLFNGNSEDGFIISDTDQVKKRIVGALGMAMGNATVKTMANRAIKRFPIIVSDDVAPETVVMLKTMFEEQYASYIDLLVSNQIINLADYSTDNSDGNIAIQALSKIDGTDFSSQRLINKAQSGKLTLDDIMQNNPGWQFIHTNEDHKYVTGNPILDELLDGAAVVPSEYASCLTEATYWMNITPRQMAEVNDEYINKNARTSSRDFINGTGTPVTAREGDILIDTESGKKWIHTENKDEWEDYEKSLKSKYKEAPTKRLDDALAGLEIADKADLYRDYKIGVRTDKTRNYEKLITPSALVDTEGLETSLDRSIAEVLTGRGAKNENERKIADYLRDRFEKASYLLVSRRISGAEYISYLNDRLGLPVSDRVRKDLLVKFPSSSVVFKGTSLWKNVTAKTKESNLASNSKEIKEIRDAINNNLDYVTLKTVPNLLGITGKDVAIVSAAGVGTGAVAAGASIAAGVASGLLFWPILAGVAIGGIGAGIVRFIQKRKENELLKRKGAAIEGWERVEALIDEMNEARADLYNHAVEIDKKLYDNDDEMYEFAKDEKAGYEKFIKQMNTSMSKVTANHDITNLKGYAHPVSEAVLDRRYEELEALDEELRTDDNLVALQESAKYIINTKKPGDIIVKQTKYNSKDVASMVPAFGTRDMLAYGSVEYDKRDIKDRKYNEPLILTIKFKERYSDGKYADNELTAVIGILGVVTRVPSDEMAYILKSNAEGKTLKNFFGGDESNNTKDLIGNVISSFMGSKNAEKLPTSGKVWNNLEKVSALAIANKLAGNNNGNISNAHLVFSQREVDIVRNEIGVDYLKNAKLAAQLMKKYAAFAVMVCNDSMQYVYSYTDPDAISWEDAPYSAYIGKSNSDQLLNAFTQFNRQKI